MAYDANGVYQPENDSVSSRLSGLLTQGSDYINNARQSGLETANSRGLLNSSVAAGAAQKAATDAALPIATADANVAAQKNLSQQGAYQQGLLNQAGYQSQEKIAGGQQATESAIAQENIASAEKQQRASIEANASLANLDTNTRLRLADLAAQNAQTLQTQQLDAQTKVALENINSNEKLAGLDAATKTALAQMQVSGQLDVAKLTTGTQLQIAGLDTTTQQNIANLNADTQSRVAAMQVQASEQNNAVSTAASAAGVYANLVDTINNNTAIPATTRAAQLANAQTLLNGMMGLIQGTYNVNLNWGPGAATGPVQPAEATPAPVTGKNGISLADQYEADTQAAAGGAPQSLTDQYRRAAGDA